MSKTVIVSYFPSQIYNHFNHTKIRRQSNPAFKLPFVCFQKVGLLYSKVEDRAGAASKFLPGAGAA
jgi:hypothetical protein